MSPRPGPTSSLPDLDFTTQPLDVGGTVVPAGALLYINGQTAPPVVYALDKNDGTVLAWACSAFRCDVRFC
jgi:hypothetical protein